MEYTTKEQTSFIKSPRLFHACTHVITTDGVEVKINPIHKMIYSYMLDMYKFRKGQGKTYFQSHESIGAYNGSSRNTANAAIGVLVEAGLVIAKSSKSTDIYTVIDHNVLGLTFINKTLETYNTPESQAFRANSIKTFRDGQKEHLLKKSEEEAYVEDEQRSKTPTPAPVIVKPTPTIKEEFKQVKQATRCFACSSMEDENGLCHNPECDMDNIPF